jgi:hypothetical protein
VVTCSSLIAACGGQTSADTDAGACMIVASNYDLSCTSDSDCAGIIEGNFCESQCLCGANSAISVAAMAQYDADFAKTPIGTGAVKTLDCGCIETGPPSYLSCRGGKCEFYSVPPSDTLAACADAGGTCQMGRACYNGPPNSCAYPDEVCCF